MPIAARSNHGCWTCRLRKKKCDENRPVCSACISLELKCHGYAPRPEWMDNGVLQQEQACKFKRLVSQAKSKKARKQQFLTSPKSPFGVRSSTSTKNILSPEPVSQNFFDEHLGTFPRLEENLNSTYQDSGIGSSNSVEALWNLWPQNDLSMMNDAWMVSEAYSSAYTTGRNQHSLPHLVSPMAFENIISGMEIPSRIDHSSNSSLNELQDSLSQNHRYQSNQPAPTANYYNHVGSPQTTTPNADTEDALFMYYLDEVFFIQHPFFYCQKKQGRGWLFAILRQVKSVYHAALALSEHQILSSSSSQSSDIASGLTKLRAPNYHYDIAIQQTQVMINDSDASKRRGVLIHNIEILMSIMQLLFIDVGKQGKKLLQR